MRKSKSERKRKCRVWLRVIIEIVFTSCGILSTVLPEPYDVYALLTIGVLRVILSAVQRERKSEESLTIVYCNGEKEPQRPKKIEKPATVTVKRKNPVKVANSPHITGVKTKKGVKA